MRYVMTLGQFLFLKQEATKNEGVTSIAETDATDGSINTHDVMVSYHYDGVALQFNVVKKYTLAAKIASDSFIEKHVDSIIADVLATATKSVVEQVAIVQPNPNPVLWKSSGIDGDAGDWTATGQDSTGFPTGTIAPTGVTVAPVPPENVAAVTEGVK